MFQDLGGPLWLLIDVAAVLALGAAIAYGTMSWSAGATEPWSARDDATRRLYKDGGREKTAEFVALEARRPDSYCRA